MVEEDHDGHGVDEGRDVRDDGDLEVELIAALGAEERHAEDLDDEETGDDDVAEAEEGLSRPVAEDVVGEEELDGAVDSHCDGDHDVRAEDPEDVDQMPTQPMRGTSYNYILLTL